MIVNREHAEQAAAVLGLETLDGLDKATVKRAYLLGAKHTHPDQGGTIEAFAAVDRAKHVLEHWIDRQGTEPARGSLKASVCPRCQGKGRIKQHRGFTAMTVTCVTCRGTGDGAYDHDRSQE